MTLLTTVEQVRAIIGEENPVVRTKLFQGLEPTAKAFIARSPLVLLATADRDGRPDVSPKGDEPGFVAVEDDQTLLVPDRKGNKLIFALQNILANPAVALIFLVPGTEETLRVHGTAELTADRAVVQRLVSRGQPALLAIASGSSAASSTAPRRSSDRACGRPRPGRRTSASRSRSCSLRGSGAETISRVLSTG